ncbi:MAG: FAD-dependent oxidoreductase [Anaerolineae bacterium]|nr:FAD-dependent oxidoreductase [Anaerolineae bacterium]
MNDILIIGAGMTGLMAANILHASGKKVVIVDKGHSLGGRMATYSVDGHPFDHGAQYFTVRDEHFREWVEQWEAAGVVKKWAQGFGTRTTNPEWRYIGMEGMTGIAKHLAHGLEVHLKERVIRIDLNGDGWQVVTDMKNTYTASALLLTAPVPQSLAMLKTGSFSLPSEARAALEKIVYEPCFAAMVLLEKPSQLPAPGALWLSGEPLLWAADNHQKGISHGYGVTLHAGPEFTKTYFDAGKDRIARLMITAAGELLGDNKVLRYDVQRWRYSRPVTLFPEPCLALADPAPLVFAGDAFVGPRVEGAALSGIAAAEQLA